MKQYSSNKDAYQIQKDFLHLAKRKLSNNVVSYDDFNKMSKQDKKTYLQRDTNSHFERNIKKYTYNRAAQLSNIFRINWTL